MGPLMGACRAPTLMAYSIFRFTAPRPAPGVLNLKIEFADAPQKVEAYEAPIAGPIKAPADK